MSKIKRKESDYPKKLKPTDIVTVRIIREFKREKRNGDDKYGNYIAWRIEKWSRAPEIVLAKRQLYVCQNGRETPYKAMGWNLADMEWLKENWDEIIKLLQED